MERDEIVKMAREAGWPITDGSALIKSLGALIDVATERANERASASWALMCEKMVVAEREAMISEAAKLGWAMKNDDPFEDAVAEVARIREMEN